MLKLYSGSKRKYDGYAIATDQNEEAYLFLIIKLSI